MQSLADSPKGPTQSDSLCELAGDVARAKPCGVYGGARSVRRSRGVLGRSPFFLNLYYNITILYYIFLY